MVSPITYGEGQDPAGSMVTSRHDHGPHAACPDFPILLHDADLVLFAQDILAGKVGYVTVPRGEFGLLYGRGVLVTGRKRSCGQDALCMCARLLGLNVSLSSIYRAVPPSGLCDTEVSALIVHSQMAMRVDWHRQTTLCRMSKGAIYALLTEYSTGVYFIHVLVTTAGGPAMPQQLVEDHAITYCAHFHGGVLMDNDRTQQPIFLRPFDRESPENARAVFNDMFPAASRVMIRHVYKLVVMDNLQESS